MGYTGDAARRGEKRRGGNRQRRRPVPDEDDRGYDVLKIDVILPLVHTCFDGQWKSRKGRGMSDL